MLTYRVRYSMYRIQASSHEEAKKKIVSLLQDKADDLVSVELDIGKQSLLSKFIWGPK